MAEATYKLILDTAVAIGTIGAVLVALFGQAFRDKFFPPKLHLRLDKPFGQIAKVQITPHESTGEPPRIESARYCLLTISNARRWSPAHDVRVSLVQVEEPGIDGNPNVLWAGDLPLTWQHKQIYPLMRTIGADAYVDLLSVVKDKWLVIEVILTPLNLTTMYRKAVKLTLTVQAFAAECTSNPLRLQVIWDGKWHDGEMEMGQHLQVTKLPDQLKLK